MGGSTTKVGSADDVSMVNQAGYDDFMKKLSGAMAGFGANMDSSGSSAMQAYGKVADTAGNYDNFMKQMTGGGGVFESLRNSTGGFNPNASMNQFMSMQPQFNQMAQGALSDVYSTGRSQAQAAGADARRAAANDLAAAGLLSSGGAVGAMTEATANPMLQMETQLAGQRAGYLSNLQGQALKNLGSSYADAGQLGGQFAGLGLQAAQGQTGALGAAAGGYGNMAQLYGGLYGQGLGYGASMNAPEYWQPQYQKNPGFLDYLTAGTSLLKTLKPYGF